MLPNHRSHAAVQGRCDEQVGRSHAGVQGRCDGPIKQVTCRSAKAGVATDQSDRSRAGAQAIRMETRCCNITGDMHTNSGERQTRRWGEKSRCKNRDDVEMSFEGLGGNVHLNRKIGGVR